MGSELLSVAQHQEFAQRMDSENAALDKRLTLVESSVTSIHEISESVRELAVSMRTMSEEQHEQHQDIREIRTTVQGINAEHIQCTLEDHEMRIHQLEITPQDSKDHEDRLRSLEGKAGKNWEKLMGAIIAGVAAFLVGLACSNMFQ